MSASGWVARLSLHTEWVSLTLLYVTQMLGSVLMCTITLCWSCHSHILVPCFITTLV